MGTLIIRRILAITLLFVAIAYKRKNSEVNAMRMKLSDAEIRLPVADEKLEQ
jgi:hypothetical protein